MIIFYKTNLCIFKGANIPSTSDICLANIRWPCGIMCIWSSRRSNDQGLLEGTGIQVSLIIRNMKLNFTQQAESNWLWIIILLIKQKSMNLSYSLINCSIPSGKCLTLMEIKDWRMQRAFPQPIVFQLWNCNLHFFTFRKILVNCRMLPSVGMKVLMLW